MYKLNGQLGISHIMLTSEICSSRLSGFTLIELVIVIVILGILAAFALLKFADFSMDARIASLESLEVATITLRCGYPCPYPNVIARTV
jgi:MSHA pilin protein MshA